MPKIFGMAAREGIAIVSVIGPSNHDTRQSGEMTTWSGQRKK
jgi:hypothetical protein